MNDSTESSQESTFDESNSSQAHIKSKNEFTSKRRCLRKKKTTKTVRNIKKFESDIKDFEKRLDEASVLPKKKVKLNLPKDWINRLKYVLVKV